MAAPIGNKNGVKNKPWTDAIRRAIARRDADAGESGAYLNRLADQLLDDCLNPEGKDARTELTNRLDGKYAQPITGDDENPLTVIQKIERLIVDPANPNA